MRRLFIVLAGIVCVSFVIGCSGLAYKRGAGIVPVELTNADKALERAQSAGKARECPEAFAEVSGMRDYAYDLQLQCNTPEAIRLANEASDMADKLCPKAVAAIPAPPPAPMPASIPAPPPAEKIIDSMSLHVHFYKNTDTIYANDYNQLNEAVDFVKKYPDAKVILEGHTDSDGPEDYNHDLSHKRAEAVKKYLVSKGGLNEENIKSIGYGEYRPLKSNDTKWGKYWNRRVDLLIVSEF